MTHMGSVLIVDADQAIGELACSLLGREGYQVEHLREGHAALARAGETPIDLAVCGLGLPDMSGLELLERMNSLFPTVGFIAMTSHGSLDSAVNALKKGALDYLTKPINPDLFLIAVKNALEKQKLVKERLRIKKEIRNQTQTKQLLGNSPQMIEVYRMVAQVAERNANCLIMGETGTGKELIARAIHFNSLRADHPFVPVNCASIPDNLLESELFGHVKGAFTGAIAAKKGLFEEASGGALFLDEIGDLSFSIQAKLLRAIQEKEIRRVGDNKSLQVNVRIISAANKDLEIEIREGRFREDLYYRLGVVIIYVPPLRARKDDISLLARHFLNRFSEEEDSLAEEISGEAMDMLQRYHWPGNVRELENVIERAVIICKGRQILGEDLPERISRAEVGRAAREAAVPGLKMKEGERILSLKEIERDYLQFVIEQMKGDKSKAARVMGVGRRTLYRKMERHKINA